MGAEKSIAVEGSGGLCTKETRTFEIEAYRDSNGAPACCVEWNKARCRFVVTRGAYGMWDTCSATGRDLWYRPADLPPNKQSNNYNLLRPVDGCPVWRK